MELVCWILCFFIGVEGIEQSLVPSRKSAFLSIDDQLVQTPLPTDLGEEDGVTDHGPSREGPAYEEVVGVEHGTVGESSLIQETQEEEIAYMAPEDQLIVQIFNKKNRHERLFDNWSGFGSFNGVFHNDQMWRLEEDRIITGKFYIVSVEHGCRIACRRRSLWCYKGGFYDDQLWGFEAKDDGYVIRNHYYSSYVMASHPGRVFGWSGGFYDDQVWRLVNPFFSKALWRSTGTFSNAKGTKSIPYVETITVGFDETITTSFAIETTFSTSVSSSVGIALEGADAGSTTTSEFTQSVKTSLSTVSKSWSKSVVNISFILPAGGSFILEQLQTDVKGRDGSEFVYQSSTTRLVPVQPKTFLLSIDDQLVQTPLPTDLGEEDGVTDHGPSREGPGYEEVVGVEHGTVGESSLIQETNTLSYMTPDDQLIVQIFNKENKNDRLFDNWSGFGSFNGVFHNDQMWRLEKDSGVPGKFYIVSVEHGCRIACRRRSLWCYKGGFYDDQLWGFEAKDGGYIISNHYYSSYVMASHPGRVFGWSGSFYDDQVWQLVNPFSSAAVWKVLHKFQNNNTFPLNWSWSITEGFSESVTSSFASESTFKHSVSTSIGIALDGIGAAGAESVQSYSVKISAALSRATTTSREVTRSYSISNILPGEGFILKQASADVTGQDGSSFTYDADYKTLEDLHGNRVNDSLVAEVA